MYQFVLFLLLFSVNASVDQDLAIAFFKSKFLSMGTVFTCASKKDNLHLIKALMESDVRVSVFHVVDIAMPLLTILDRKYHHLGVILDGDCENVALLLQESGNYSLFDDTRHWLVTSNTTNTADLFKDVVLNVNANVHLAVNQNNYSIIYDLYNPGYSHGGELKVKQLGRFDENIGYQAYIMGNKYWERKNMTGTKFKSAIVVPHLEGKLEDYLTSDEHRERDSMHRFQSVTVNHCRDMYNFTLHVQRTDSWGYIQANGVFNGLVRLLELKEVDFGSSPLIYKLDRMPVIDYSFGNWILRSAFIYRRPKPQLDSYQIFLRPLDKTVWYLIIVTMFVILIVLWITFKAERKFTKSLHEIVETTWSYLALFILASFCQQGSVLSPYLCSGKAVTMSLFIFTLVIYQFYSASIVSYLLMDPPRTIFNLKDLLDSSLEVGIEDILIDRDYFVQTTDPVAIQLYQRKIKGKGNDSRFYDPEVGLNMVKKGGFAFHVETSTAYPIIEETFSNQEICELEEVQMYSTQPMHTNLQKHSPFKEMLTYCMMRLVEDGLMVRLRKHWDARRPECIKSAMKIKISVGIEEFSCAMVIFIIGASASLIFLALERFGKKFEKFHITPKVVKPIHPYIP